LFLYIEKRLQKVLLLSDEEHVASGEWRVASGAWRVARGPPGSVITGKTLAILPQ